MLYYIQQINVWAWKKENPTWDGGFRCMDTNFPPLQSHAASQLPHLSRRWPHLSTFEPWSHRLDPTYTHETQILKKQKLTMAHLNSSLSNTKTRPFFRLDYCYSWGCSQNTIFFFFNVLYSALMYIGTVPYIIYFVFLGQHVLMIYICTFQV